VFGSTRTAGTEAGRFDGGEGSEIAEQVLNTLIDARLLTSYELPAENDEDSPQQRIEIIHESLLANWPRLVRWQTQDADSAQLRDQIRQVAQMWEEGGRPEDLLWTGTSYDEYQLWRERYSGGLSTAEESFTTAMTAHAERRKRLRRGAIAAVITVLVIGLGIVGTFWRQAVAASQRAEANQLLALGRLEIENNPTGAVAYALASLERADDPVTRLFALEALWRGPTALVLGGYPGNERLGLSLDFSPDGKWLVGGQFEGLQLWSSTGGAPRLLDSQQAVRSFVRFGPDSDLVVSQDYGKDVVEVRSVPDGRLVRTLPTQGQVDFRLAENPARIFTFTQQGSRARVEAWPLTGGGPEPFGNLESNVSEYSRYHFAWNLNLDPTGTRIVYVPHFDADERQGSTEDIYLVELADKAQAPPKLVGSHEEGISRATFHPDGEHLASADTSGEVRIWDLEAGAESPARVLHQPPAQWVRNIRFDPTGSRLATATWSGFAAMWDLEGPPDADPLLLRRGETGWTIDAAFHPEGRWLATASHLGVAIWPIAGRYPLKLNGHERAVRGVAFLPDSERLASVGADGTRRLWPLSAAAGDRSRVLFRSKEEWITRLVVDRAGRQILASSPGGSVWFIPLDETAPRKLRGFDAAAQVLATGTHYAAAIGKHGGTRVLRVWDLETGEFQDLETGSKIRELRFTPDDHMISAGPAGIRTWNFADGSFETLSESVGRIDFTRDWSIDFSRDGRLLLVGNQGDNGEAVLYDLGAETSLQLDSHGPSRCGKLDPAGKFAVTRPCEGPGYLQVGPVSGGPVHLLVSQDPVSYIAISPDGKWIASLAGDQSHTIHLWPVPDLAQPPLHTLPLDQLLAKLRTLTNLRVVEDPESTSGWNWGLDPFPGWEEMPTW
ncbi:MAG: WD40 repeat domain-containing protein, partial [Thermoanaerobaculia bacterium]